MISLCRLPHPDPGEIVTHAGRLWSNVPSGGVRRPGYVCHFPARPETGTVRDKETGRGGGEREGEGGGGREGEGEREREREGERERERGASSEGTV